MKTLASPLRFLFALLTATALSHSASAEVIVRGTLDFRPLVDTGRLNIQGNYLYLALNTAELRILDISDRNNPVLVGSVQTRLGNGAFIFYGTDVEVAGDYAYVNCGPDVVVVNIANKANPTVVTRLPRPTQTMSLDISDGILYVGDSTSLGMYSLANPAAPQHLGTFNANSQVREVIVANQLAYLAAHSGGFMIVDVANPATPTRVGLAPAAPAASPIDLVLDGNRAYVTTDFALKIYDVSNPTSPALLGQTGLGVGNPMFRDAVAYSNGFVYVHGYFQSFQVVDVRNPAQPQLVLNTNLPGSVGAGPGSTGADVLADGNTLFVANGPAGVRLFDISTPGAPQPISNYLINTLLQSVVLTGNRAYASDPYGQILAIDTAVPTAPRVVTRVQTIYLPRYLYTAGNRLFSLFEGGFEIYTLANPDLPTLVGRYMGPITSLASSGNYVFLARPGAIDTLDISNPSAIATVATRDLAGNINLALSGSYLAASANTAPTYVFDITNPLSFREVGTYAQAAAALDFDGNTLFIYNANGIRALIVTPNAVTPADTIDMQGPPSADSGRLWVSSTLADARDLSNIVPAGTAGLGTYDIDASGAFNAIVAGSLFYLVEGTLPDATPRPSLEAIYNGSQLTIRWPATFSDYKLYVAPSIGAQWELVSDTLPQENGYFIYLNRFPTAPMRLYQLIKQP